MDAFKFLKQLGYGVIVSMTLGVPRQFAHLWYMGFIFATVAGITIRGVSRL